MAEGVDAALVDVGDGAGHRQVEVALDERDADGRAGLQVGHGAAGCEPVAPPPITGVKPIDGEDAARPLEGVRARSPRRRAAARAA